MLNHREKTDYCVIEALMKRRSIREYDQGKEIPEEALNKIIQAAMYAPSFENRRPWHFIVISYKHLLSLIQDTLANDFNFEAKALIIVCTDTTLDNQKGWWIQDCAAATQNLLLAAHGLGLASCWYGIHPVKHRKELLKKNLHLPKSIQPFSIVTLGYPARTIDTRPKTVRRIDRYKIHFNKW
jgi:nitroreductase